MADRILQLKLISDVTSINKGIGEVNTKLGAMTSALRGVAAGFVAAFAVTSIIDFGSEAVEMASSIEESTAKLQTLLGAHADIALAFAEDAVALGLSKEAALEAQGTFAGLMRTIGLGEAEAAAQSKAFVQLAIDMAAFSNTSVDEALVAIGAGLRGESEPLRRFSVILDDATLKAAALEQGLYDGIGPLTAQERAMAAMAVIMAQTAIQQGNFVATADQMAGSQKQLNAQFANAQAAIGMALLPVLTQLALVIKNDIIPLIGSLWEQWSPTLAAIAAGVGAFVARVLEVWNKLQPAFQAFVDFVSPLLAGLLAFMAGIFAGVTGTLDAVIALLNGDFTAAWNAIVGAVRAVFEGVATATGEFLGFLSGIVGTFGQVAGSIGNAIFNGIADGFNRIVGVVRDVVNTVIGALNRINSFSWERQGFEINTPLGNAFVGFDSGSFQLWPDIPFLAKGGIVDGPTLAMLGEAGREAVIPLDRMGGMGDTYNINVNVAPGGDLVATGKAIVDAIRQYERRSGRVWRSA